MTCQDLFQRSTLSEMEFQQVASDTVPSSGLRESESVCQPYVLPRVIRLFGTARPAAVFRRIRSVVISALDGVSRWARTHVDQERGEVLRPSFTNRDTATAIVGISRMSCAGATRPHCHPGLVLARRTASWTQTMSSRSLTSQFGTQAPTTIRVTTQESSAENYRDIPAVASARPVVRAVAARESSVFSKGGHKQSSESSIGQVGVFKHRRILPRNITRRLGEQPSA